MHLGWIWVKSENQNSRERSYEEPVECGVAGIAGPAYLPRSGLFAGIGGGGIGGRHHAARSGADVGVWRPACGSVRGDTRSAQGDGGRDSSRSSQDGDRWIGLGSIAAGGIASGDPFGDQVAGGDRCFVYFRVAHAPWPDLGVIRRAGTRTGTI